MTYSYNPSNTVYNKQGSLCILSHETALNILLHARKKLDLLILTQKHAHHHDTPPHHLLRITLQPHQLPQLVLEPLQPNCILRMPLQIQLLHHPQTLVVILQPRRVLPHCEQTQSQVKKVTRHLDMGTAVDLPIDLECLAILLDCFIVITTIDLIQSDVAQRRQQINTALGVRSLFKLIGFVEVIDRLLELAEFLADGTQNHVDVCAFRSVLGQVQLQNVKSSTIFLLRLLVFLQSEVAVPQHRQHDSLLLVVLGKTRRAFLEHILEIINGFRDPSIFPGVLTHLIQHTTFLSDGLPLALRILDASQDVDQTAIVVLLQLVSLLLLLFILFSRVYLHAQVLRICM